MSDPDLFAMIQGILGIKARRYPEHPGFKRAGTSQDAAVSATKHDANLQSRCLKALRERGPLTADEVAEILGKTPFSIRPRFSQLFKLGQIVDTSQRRRNASGKMAVVWRAT